jgi:hypothetical protein
MDLPSQPFSTRRSSSFIASVVSRHVSRRAAEHVDLSQPAMSHALARLRHVLDDDLLVRGPSRFALTPRAEEIAPCVTAITNAARVIWLAAVECYCKRMPSPGSRSRRAEASSRRWLQSLSAFPSQPSLPPSSTRSAKEQGKKQTSVPGSNYFEHGATTLSTESHRA